MDLKENPLMKPHGKSLGFVEWRNSVEYRTPETWRTVDWEIRRSIGIREPSNARNKIYWKPESGSKQSRIKLFDATSQSLRVPESQRESVWESCWASESQGARLEDKYCVAEKHTPSLIAGCLIGVKPNARNEVLQDNPKHCVMSSVLQYSLNHWNCWVGSRPKINKQRWAETCGQKIKRIPSKGIGKPWGDTRKPSKEEEELEEKPPNRDSVE
jgi:hypothetical protein